jgi:Rod binding domain-containing protein
MDGIPLNTMAADQARQHALDPTALRRLGREGDVDAAAHEMEKLFATMLVGELRKALPEGFFGGGAGHDTYGAWFDEHLGGALAESGALELAGQVKASLGAEPSDPAAEPRSER